MASLKWNLNTTKLVVYDKKLDKALVFDRDEGISFYCGDHAFTVDPSIIASAYMDKPRLFKKGVIALFDADDEVIQCEGINLGVAVSVSRKYKDDFYLMYSVLKDNGIDVTVG